MFEKDLIVGEKGEDVVYNLLRHSPKVKQIMDVTQSKNYQEEDVDLLVQTYDNQIYKVEIKHDTQADKTGNIPFETMSNSNIGCLARSKADFVFWVTDTKVYWHRLDKLKELIKHTTTLQIIPMGDNARGYLLPISYLKERGVLNEISC